MSFHSGVRRAKTPRPEWLIRDARLFEFSLFNKEGRMLTLSSPPLSGCLPVKDEDDVWLFCIHQAPFMSNRILHLSDGLFLYVICDRHLRNLRV